MAKPEVEQLVEQMKKLSTAEKLDLLRRMIEEGILQPSPDDDNQEWYWTRSWQEGEREADADVLAGRVERFQNVEDAIKELHRFTEENSK